MRFRKFSKKQTILTVAALTLPVLGALLMPVEVQNSLQASLTPAQEQVGIYHQKALPWTGVCRSGAMSSCGSFGVFCTPSKADAEAEATYNVQLCIENLGKACEGTFSAGAIEINTEVLDHPWSLDYDVIYYAESTVTCSE